MGEDSPQKNWPLPPPQKKSKKKFFSGGSLRLHFPLPPNGTNSPPPETQNPPGNFLTLWLEVSQTVDNTPCPIS